MGSERLESFDGSPALDRGLQWEELTLFIRKCLVLLATSGGECTMQYSSVRAIHLSCCRMSMTESLTSTASESSGYQRRCMDVSNDCFSEYWRFLRASSAVTHFAQHDALSSIRLQKVWLHESACRIYVSALDGQSTVALLDGNCLFQSLRIA